MEESRDVTMWPGALVETPEHLAQVAARHGAELSSDHVRACDRCGKDYYMRTPGKSPVCYGCWYVMELDSYEEAYRDVFDALKAEGLEPSIGQTGGMCMVIHVPLEEGGYLWLTDAVDTLSFERRPEDGWCAGVYRRDDEDSDGMPEPVFDGEDYASREEKTAGSAVELAELAAEKWAEYLRNKEETP